MRAPSSALPRSQAESEQDADFTPSASAVGCVWHGCWTSELPGIDADVSGGKG